MVYLPIILVFLLFMLSIASGSLFSHYYNKYLLIQFQVRYELDAVHRMNEGNRAWVVLSNRGLGIKAK